ncbi:hypothetical protein BBJ28_00021980 [Nothophytophthora sp. Chile5]|nr:hypothetical protein BBJ28_00021980 [Nothophytophthora sp. Chile5]
MRSSAPTQHHQNQLARSSGAVGLVKSSTLRAIRVPKFLRSLYDILHYEDQTILTWSKDGTYFQIYDTKRLETAVLPKYFKHGKFASFQRQLNNFGFRKWTKTQSSVCTFSHHHLVRRHPQQLAEFISRRPPAASSQSAAEASKHKRTFTDLLGSSDAASPVSGKTAKRENGGFCRALQAIGSELTSAANPSPAKSGARWATEPVAFLKASEENSNGTPTSSSTAPAEQPFNFTPEDLHDIVLPASVTERHESRSSDRMFELRMLNECLDLGPAGTSYAAANNPGGDLFPSLPYNWDSDIFFAPPSRPYFEVHVQDRAMWRSH